MPCNKYVEWLDIPGNTSGALPETLSRHFSECSSCLSAQKHLQAFQGHCATMSPDAGEALSLWESILPQIPVPPGSPPPQSSPSSSPSGNTGPASSPGTTGLASSTVAAPAGIGPIVILVAASILIGVIEYGLTSRQSGPVTGPATSLSDQPRIPSGANSTAAVSITASTSPDLPEQKKQPATPPLPALQHPPEKQASPSAGSSSQSPRGTKTPSTFFPPAPGPKPVPVLPQPLPTAIQIPVPGQDDTMTDGFVPLATSPENRN